MESQAIKYQVLISSYRVDDGEKTLPVASNLPPRYLSHEHHGGRASSSVDVKMVDGGKPLFKLKLRLNSTIYTKVCIIKIYTSCTNMMAVKQAHQWMLRKPLFKLAQFYYIYQGMVSKIDSFCIPKLKILSLAMNARQSLLMAY